MKVEVPFETPDQVSEWCIHWLERAGYTVTQRPEERSETPKEISIRLNLPGQPDSRYLSRRLNQPDHPPVKTFRGPSGRVRALITTPEFEAWLLKPLREIRDHISSDFPGQRL